MIVHRRRPQKKKEEVPRLMSELKRMNNEVEIFGMTDPPYIARRSVWYWVEFEGRRSDKTESHAQAEAWAASLCAEHDTCLIDRSDRGSGYLRSTLPR